MVLIKTLPKNAAISVPHSPVLVATIPALIERGVEFLLRLKIAGKTVTIGGYKDGWELSLTPGGTTYVRLTIETRNELSDVLGDPTVPESTHLYEDFELLAQVRGVTGTKLEDVYAQAMQATIGEVLNEYYLGEGVDRISRAVGTSLAPHCKTGKGFDPATFPIIVNEVAKEVIEFTSRLKLVLVRTIAGELYFGLVPRTGDQTQPFVFMDGVFTDVDVRPGTYAIADVDFAELKSLPSLYHLNSRL